MSTYLQSYIETRDIDWFFIVNGKYPIHASSFGGDLPAPLNNREANREIQMLVAQVMNDDININRVAITPWVDSAIENHAYGQTEVARAAYLTSFVRMANLGFYSFDRANLSNRFDNLYKLVAFPKQDSEGTILIPDINDDIKALLPSVDIPEDVVYRIMNDEVCDLVNLVEVYAINNKR